jgi:hypothetical protein
MFSGKRLVKRSVQRVAKPSRCQVYLKKISLNDFNSENFKIARNGQIERFTPAYLDRAWATGRRKIGPHERSWVAYPEFVVTSTKERKTKKNRNRPKSCSTRIVGGKPHPKLRATGILDAFYRRVEL